MKHFRRWVAVLIVWLCTFSLLQGQAMKHTGLVDSTEVRTVTPGASYEAEWLHRLFFGTHWRRLWTTPIEVPVLDLNTFAGGLKPLKRGGGLQTRSLRFAGADGKQYKFRSINKDPEKLLPEKLRNTIAKDILQDQISSANPLAPLVVSPLLNGVGILNANPQLFTLPDDPQLGAFREEFGGLLGTIEEHPNEGLDDEAIFGGADKVISTYTLFEKMEEDFHHRIDEYEYLKARLMDIVLGDWDRHTDQWRWAGFETGGWWIWKPIPRDRDQAFARFDGLLPWTADVIAPMLGVENIAQLSHFSDEYPSIADLTWSGRFLDRRLMNSLTKAEWDSVALWLEATLSDSLIEAAVHRLPPPSYEAGGSQLLQSLKSRREALSSASDEFYRLVASYPDLRGSDKDETVNIRRLSETQVEVSLFDRHRRTGGTNERPFFQRIFDSENTSEIRIYLLGGDDLVIVTGEVDGSIPVYVDGGTGRDELLDSSRVGGSFLGIVPFVEVTKTATFFFTDDDDLEPVRAAGTRVNEIPRARKPASQLERWEPSLRDYGRSWRIGTMMGVSPDEGVVLGGGPVWTKFGFHEDPFVYRLDARAAYATHAKKFRAEVTGVIPFNEGRAQFLFHVKASQLELLNYFGFGNETLFDKELVTAGYFKVRQQQFILEQRLEWQIATSLRLSFGAALKFVDTDPASFSLLYRERPYGLFNLSLASINTALVYDSRDSRIVPSQGWFSEVRLSYVPSLFNLREHFGRLRTEARGYVRLPLRRGSVLALRLAGEGLAGDFPFFEAAFLGGSETLRGFEKQRFAGQAMALANTELRLPMSEFMFVVPMTFGISVLGESGRVFVRGERSGRWHSSVGGGAWLSFVDPEATVSVSIARSGERLGVYFRGGFMF